MTEPAESTPPPEPLDRLVDALLACGGALSQMISHMVAFEESGHGGPHLAPIPEVAHTLIRGVLTGVQKHYSKRDLNVAARLVSEATDAICNDIFFVPLEAFGEPNEG